MKTIYEIISPSGTYKASIQERPDKAYQVRCFKWTHEALVGERDVCPPFWAEIGRTSSITDTIELARDIANEKLETISGEKIQQTQNT